MIQSITKGGDDSQLEELRLDSDNKNVLKNPYSKNLFSKEVERHSFSPDSNVFVYVRNKTA